MIYLCHYCKKSFKANNVKSKYCSHDCYWKGKVGSKKESKRSVSLVCSICGVNFLRYFCHLKRKGTGKYCSRACVGISNGKKMSGKNHWNWKGGITPRDLNSKKYREWRTAVFERDNYKCVKCGYDKGRILQADHIKSWKDYPKLRFDVSNGRTLCKPCHIKTPSWGSHRK